MKRIHWLRIFDGLLPLSVLLFLLPFNPQISTLPALLWLLKINFARWVEMLLVMRKGSWKLSTAIGCLTSDEADSLAVDI